MAKKAWLIATCVLLSGCGPDWRDLAPLDSRFRVRLPGAAQCGPLPRLETPLGPLRGRSCGVEVKPWMYVTRDIFPATYSVEWYGLPAGLEARDALVAVQIAWRHGAPKDMKVTERPATLGGEVGTEIETELHEESLRLHFLVRTCVHEGRIYRAGFMGSLDAENERVWASMLDSFRFTS